MSESAGKTLIIATILCVVCSVFVSGAVVTLKPRQDYEAAIDFKKNILMSTGLYKEGADVNEIFKQVETIVVDLTTGLPAEGVDVKTFSQEKADKDSSLVQSISSKDDFAKIKSRSKYQTVYLLKNNGQIEQVVLHVYGKGLFSTMKGFLALDKDTKTVKGFKFYSHGETPGLGGEVDKDKWINQWPGKVVYDENWSPAIDVIKGNVSEATPGAEHKVDGLTGATMTSNGVEGTFKYWLSENGYGKFLSNVRDGGLN